MSKPTPLQTTQTILDVLRPDFDANSWLNNNAIEWDDLVIRAIVFGLAPQLYVRLAAQNVALPPRASAKLKVSYVAQRKRSEAIYTQLAEVLAACEQHGLEPIALKGVHLAEHIYAERALRPMNDIDLLFRPKQLPLAEQMLRELEYGGKHKSAESGAGVTKHTSTFKRENGADNTPNPYLSTQNERMIEPHISLEESWFGLKADITPNIFDRAIPVQFGDHTCLVLAPVDLLMHICVHFCFHLIQGAPSLVQFSDVLAISNSGQVDWDKFVARSAELAVAPYAYAALWLARNHLGAPVPPPILHQLAKATPVKLRDRITQLTLADILQRSQQKPLTTWRDRLQRGFADRSATAQWAGDWRSRWRVWRTLLQPSRMDSVQLLLGRSLKEEV